MLNCQHLFTDHSNVLYHNRVTVYTAVYKSYLTLT